MSDGRSEDDINCNYDCVTYYKQMPPQIIKCPHCEFKAYILPNGRSKMMEHLENKHDLSFRDAMGQTARIPAMAVVDLDIL